MSHEPWRPLLAALILMAAFSASGCSYYRNNISQERLENGLTIILPGIEGPSVANSNIARGLETGGVATAIEVHDWTTGFAPLMLLHLRDGRRHQKQANELAQKIVDYQALYPGRPVYLIGHSGGGGMVLRTLEALPQHHTITAAILLAPAISPGYPIEEVLAKTEAGIWNYYSPLDAPLLIAGTMLAGTVDGVHTPSAGAIGFHGDSDELADQPNGPRLVQVPYSPKMLANRNPGGHFGWTDPSFVRSHLAQVILETPSEPLEIPVEPQLERGIEFDPRVLPAGYSERSPR